MNKILEFKTYLQKTNQQGIALDIDETLSWTIGYWVEHLQKKFGNPENLSVKDIIAKYRYSQNVPYWQTEEAMAWMEEHRNSNEIQEVLPLIENADTIVQKIHKITPIVAYITTRPETVLDGTKKWLRKHKFPQVDVIANIARPLNIHLIEGNKWKAEVLSLLYPEVLGIIDDNPGLVDHLPKNYKGTVYLYDSVDHTRKDINVIPCKTWNDVLNKMSNN